MQIATLHSVSKYVPRMGIPESPWENGSFASKGGIACGTIACAIWPLVTLNQTRATIHVPTDLAIDAALAADLDTNLLGTFSSTDMNVEPLRIRKTIYLPAPFARLFLKWDLMPMEAWTRLRGAIINGGI